MLQPKKHGFRLAEISRVQGSGTRVTPKALVAVMTADDRTCGVLSWLSGHVFEASWLFVPDGGSYRGSWCFTYCMALISPCGLMDISYWLISLVFHVEEELECAFTSYIYWYISYSISLA